MMVKSGSKRPFSLGFSIIGCGVSCTTGTNKQLNEIWHIYIANSVHRFGISNMLTPTRSSTTNLPAYGLMIPTKPPRPSHFGPKWNPSPKGGEEKAFSIPMPTVLMPLLEKLKTERRSFTLDFPFQPSRRWQQFFIKLKLTHLCIHCLRVTYLRSTGTSFVFIKFGSAFDKKLPDGGHAPLIAYRLRQKTVCEWQRTLRAPRPAAAARNWD
jgi:hypothetical protein